MIRSLGLINKKINNLPLPSLLAQNSLPANSLHAVNTEVWKNTKVFE